MSTWILVAICSALGGVLRHALDLAAKQRLGPETTWGILAANVLGSFCIGLVMAWQPPGSARTFLATGVLGGFTTFSTFSLHVVAGVQQGRWMAAGGYLGATLIGALGGCAAGLAMRKG